MSFFPSSFLHHQTGKTNISTNLAFMACTTKCCISLPGMVLQVLACSLSFCGVQNISQPHCFQFALNNDDNNNNKVDLYTKDYHSSPSSSWLGPYSFLNIVPHHPPQELQPALFNESLLADTFNALNMLFWQWPHRHSSNTDLSQHKDNFSQVVHDFAFPPSHLQICDGFSWVFSFFSSAQSLKLSHAATTGSAYSPINLKYVTCFQK